MFPLQRPSNISLLLLLLSASFDSVLAQSFLPIPLPNGSYNTTFTSTKLVDDTRQDPYADTSEPRALMISLFHPRECDATQIVDYSAPATAAFTDEFLGLPNGTFELFKLQVCENTPTQEIDDASSDPEFPVVLFSHGLGAARPWYNALAQWVASHGYSVVTIDHPYDAAIVEFPDGTVVHGIINDTSTDLFEPAIEVRKEDAKFVLDQMANPSVVCDLIPGSKGGLDVSRAAIFGHSLGGATAANALCFDSRLKGGINLDGTIYGPAQDQDNMHPFIIFGTETHNRSSDPTWQTFWSHLLGWKKGFLYEGAGHLTYSDGPILMNLAGVDSRDLPPKYQMGGVDGLRNLEVLSAYVSSFFDLVLKGQGLGVPTSPFPEINPDF